MRPLTQERLDLIEALVAEADIGGVTAALLEKDEHLTDALCALFQIRIEGLQLVFCGGSSLSKGHHLIERMSEDADLKVVVHPGVFTSKTKVTNALRQLTDQTRQTMMNLGFVEDEKQYRVRNEYRYVHTQWLYRRNYDSPAGLRPNLQLEFTARSPQLPIERPFIEALVDRLAQRDGVKLQLPTICVAETLAEKVLSFLRRFAQHRAGAMKQEWDTALVRHIHDAHCICQRDAGHIESASRIFRALVDGDRAEFGGQFPRFDSDPRNVLAQALEQTREDAQTRGEYERNLLPLIYGSDRPSFEQAHASFSSAANRMISAL